MWCAISLVDSWYRLLRRHQDKEEAMLMLMVPFDCGDETCGLGASTEGGFDDVMADMEAMP